MRGRLHALQPNQVVKGAACMGPVTAKLFIVQQQLLFPSSLLFPLTMYTSCCASLATAKLFTVLWVPLCSRFLALSGGTLLVIGIAACCT